MGESSAGGDKGMTWRDFAACQGAPLDLFYLYDGERYSAARQRLERGRRICARCPVRDRCQEEAYEIDDRYGLLGGLTPDERDEKRGRHVEKAGLGSIAGHDENVVEMLVNGENVPHASRLDIAHACVRLWRLGGVSQAALGRRFGFGAGTVRNWIERSENGQPPISLRWWAQQNHLPLAEVS